MTKRRDQKTEELSVTDLEEMLAAKTAGTPTEPTELAPQPPGPMRSRPSVPPPPPPTRPSKPPVSVEDSFVETIIDGRYEVVRCLGTGAMGIVFLVRHVRLNKQFALKIINPHLAELPEFAARFEREADACSRLQHPNCISVTDFGQDVDGRLFLVMEYAEGTLLNHAVGDNPLSILEAMQYTKQILLGLRHAHKEGLVHRDIKMENVVKCIGDDGEPVLKILDFGMAKHPVMDNLTAVGNPDGLVMGTPQYMSPEQIRDDGVDARTDLYAVGVTLFRLITGTPVFKGNNPLDVFAAKMSAPAPSLQDVTGKTYPEALESFLAKALERNPAERFASADEMLEALERVIESVRGDTGKTPLLLGIAAPWLLSIRNNWSRYIRNKWVVAGAAGAVVLIVLLAALLGGGDDTVSNSQASTTPTIDRTAPTPSPQEPTSPPAPSANLKDEAVPPAENPPVLPEAAAPPPIAVADADSSTDPVLLEAALLIEKRQCKKAEKLLLSQNATGSARSLYLLGRASVCRRREADALAYYQSAFKLDGRYRADTGILEDAERMLSSTKMREKAIAFMADDIGKTALPTLIQAAGHHKTRAVRKAAMDAVSRLGALDHVDLAASYELDLNQAGSCNEKRAVIAKLAALGTKQAKQVLYRAREAQVRINIFRSRYVHECVRPDIQKALAGM